MFLPGGWGRRDVCVLQTYILYTIYMHTSLRVGGGGGDDGVYTAAFRQDTESRVSRRDGHQSWRGPSEEAPPALPADVYTYYNIYSAAPARCTLKYAHTRARAHKHRIIYHIVYTIRVHTHTQKRQFGYIIVRRVGGGCAAAYIRVCISPAPHPPPGELFLI